MRVIGNLLAGVLYLSSVVVNAQQGGEQALLDAVEVSREDPQKAIGMLEAILEVEPDTSVVYARSFFNIAVLYSVIADVENTIKWYEKVMTSDLDDEHPGTGFMESYACYHHNAAMQLGIFLYNQQMLEEALPYFDKALQQYPYQSTSGTSIGKRKNTIEMWMARCHHGLGDTNQAIVELLRGSCDCYAPMRSDLDAGISELIELNGGKKKFKKSLDKSLDNIEYKAESTDNTFPVHIWSFELYGHEIEYCQKDPKLETSTVINLIKENSWYNN